MFVLTIMYDEEEDMLKVDGPIKHPILCYGMLGRARDVIKDYATKNAKRKDTQIITDPNEAGGGKGGNKPIMM